MSVKLRNLFFFLGMGFITSASNSNAAGFEKSVLWSGHYAAIGGAASSEVTGSQALYFNPAGLAKTKYIDLSAHLSPTFSQFTAPILTNPEQSSNRSPSFPAAGFVAYSVTPKLGVGLGAYVSGGTKAIFQDFATTPAFNPEIKTDLAIVEFALGAGYEIIEGVRIGAAYRIVRPSADLAFIGPSSLGGIAQTSLTGLSQTRYNGFKAGLQISPKEAKWGIGAQWRSEIEFNASGDEVTSSPAGSLPQTTATVGATFPQQVSIGGYYDFCPEFRLLLEYTFTEYHKNKTLNVAITGVPAPLPLPMHWNNMNNGRIGAEYHLAQMDLRAGYVYTSQVTPNGDARPTFSSPGAGHTFAIGAGKTLFENFTADVALEYSRASGTVTVADAATGTTNPQPGDYSSNSYTIHLSASYQL